MSMNGQVADVGPGRGAVDEAEAWFVRMLEPGCTAEQRRAFERWRAASAANEAAYREVEHLWSLGAEAALGDPVLMMAARRARRPTPRRTRSWLVPTLAAAALVLAVLGSLRWSGYLDAPTRTEYATAIGQRRTVALPDGSTLVLDTNSDVQVRYDGKARNVDLLRGRVQFHVKSNARWPFVVHVQGGTVTDVGTTFQVGLDGDKADVALLEGRVDVATQRDGRRLQASLQPGQQLEFDRAGIIGPVQPLDMTAAKGWTSGKLYVDNWRLPALLAEMNRYSTTQLEIGDPSLDDLRISGVFRADDPGTLLLVLQQGWSIHARRVDPKRVVLSRR